MPSEFFGVIRAFEEFREVNNRIKTLKNIDASSVDAQNVLYISPTRDEVLKENLVSCLKFRTLIRSSASNDIQHELFLDNRVSVDALSR